MATAEHIKTLIRSHFGDESERFVTVVLQVAAHEAKQGHSELAREIREMVDRARRDQKAVKILSFPPDLDSLVRTEEPDVPLTSLVLSEALMERIRRILHEYHNRDKLRHHSLSHRRKVLLVGPPGTGKTLTARVLACELRLPLHIVQVDRLVTKYMGETSAKLRQIFDLIKKSNGVYFFDEFDAIGGGRELDNDVGEMRRVLNALLQFIEQDESESMILAATNSPGLLDRALFRRFDDVLQYHLPDASARERLIGNVLGAFVGKRFGWKTAIRESNCLSSADIALACRDAMKDAVLSNKSCVTAASLEQAFSNRRLAHSL